MEKLIDGDFVIGEYTYYELEEHFMSDEVQARGVNTNGLLWWGFQAQDGGLSLVQLTEEQYKIFTEERHRRWSR